MFMGLPDASKAFDRIRHSTLFNRLIGRQVPSYIVIIMIYWYKLCLYAGAGFYRRDFKSLKVSCKVAYSHLFNVYIDDLSAALTQYRTGYCIYDKYNHKKCNTHK